MSLSRTAPARRGVAFVLVLGLLVQFVLLPLLAPRPAYAFSSTWTFDTAGNYTVSDSNEVQFNAGKVEANWAVPWWNTSFLSRKKLTVSAGSTAITTSNTITFNEDFTAAEYSGKIQADQDDLRIVYWNGTTNTDLDRDYLAEGLGNPTSGSDVRFKAQAAISASGSDSNYYLYYNNSSATAGPQNPANIYEYYDDFSSNDGWDLTGSGTGWEVSTGRLRKTTAEAVDRFSGDENNTFSATKDWYSEATFNRDVSTNTISIGWFNGVSPPTQGWWATNFGTTAGAVQIWRNFGHLNPDTTIGSVAIANSTDYRKTLEYTASGSCPSGKHYRAWVNGTLRNDSTETTASNCPATLIPGVHFWNSGGSFDDYKVWQSLGETVSDGTEETDFYPTTDPTVTPTTPITFDTLSSFTETATKNGGEIKYLLSNDGGTTWKYHNGVAWVTSNGTYAQATTAADINANAATFPTGSRSFLFRAFLHSSGTQLVQLDTVSINGNLRPNTPTLAATTDGSTVSTVTPTLTMTATDGETDYVQFKLQVDTVNTFDSANLQTFDQATSQTGWSGQDAQSNTAYASGTTASFTFPSALAGGTTYYWRAAATDPGGANAQGSYSSAGSFVTPTVTVPSGIQASTITTTSAIVLWSTDRAATSKVEYGTTTSYGSEASVTGTRTSHQVVLSNLLPSTSYHYRVTGVDSTGQTYTSSDQTFTTLGNTVITNVQAAPLSSKSVKITWTTNHLADTKVRYGPTTAYGQEYYDATPVLEHEAVLTDLDPNTTFHYEVLSVGNTSTNDADATFLTMATTPTILKPVAGAEFLKGRPVKVIGLAPSGQTVTVYVDGVEDGTTTARTTSTGTGDFAYTVKAKLNGGAHTIAVKGTSPITGSSTGNDSPTSTDVAFEVVLPFIAPTLHAPVIEGGDSPSVTIRGVAPSGARLSVLVDGKEARSLTAPVSAKGSSSFSVTIDPSAYGAGEHTVEVVAYDENDKPSKTKTAGTFTVQEDGDVVPKLTKDVRYVVVGGDSLWRIAQKFFGDGRRYPDLVADNAETYPSLLDNPSLILPGWQLTIRKRTARRRQ